MRKSNKEAAHTREAIVATAAGAAIAPAPVRPLARLGFAGYLGALALAGIRARSQATSDTDAALVPVTLAIMHFGHGLGALEGFRMYGLPLAALAQLGGRADLAGRLARPPSPVYAPSLG